VTSEQEETKSRMLVGTRAYALAAVCVGVALLLRLILDSLWADRLPFGLFFLAVIVVTQFADAKATVFAIVAGFLLADWFFF